MSWFRNNYICYGCGHEWVNWWSSACDDDCPSCGARHASPEKSDDLTVVIALADGVFTVWRSPASAARTPEYQHCGDFATVVKAEAFSRTLGD
jgi:hypothetical protein